ncbi:hypothetical protein ABBQ38_002409 [Trebouxia sp. C0009 RCD-2024]
MTGLYGNSFVYANPQQRCLSDTATLNVALQELSKVLHYSDRVVCNLSSSGLTPESARELAQRLKKLKKLHALDLSSNYIRVADWQDAYDLAADFLMNNTVEYLDLGLNYLPPLQSLTDNAGLYDKFRLFGQRIALGLYGCPLTGMEDVDHWIQNAERFRQEAYGYDYAPDV